MRKLLWIGDAVASTGFSRCTHRILEVLREKWDVCVLGLNYWGDPHDYPYPIYPASVGGDAFGVRRVAELVSKIRPDLVVVQNDPWNIPEYVRRVGNVPTVAVMPVDGKNCKGRGLNGVRLAIFWTQFGAWEAALGGYQGKSVVIPLGVDLDIYQPGDRMEARAQVKIPEDVGFIVGNINRNQPRKRLDLTVEYFAEWVKDYKVDDAYLFLHIAPTGEDAYDCGQLLDYYGLGKRLIYVEPEMGKGISEKGLSLAYQTFDVQVTTTQGEGWGLTQMEGMACGIPQIAPDWAALGEWARDVAVLVPCTSHCVTTQQINAIGGVPHKEQFVAALDLLYRDSDQREVLCRKGIELVARPEYRWEAIGQRYLEVLVEV